MGRGGRSVTEVQTRILGQFSKELRSQHTDTAINAAIEAGKKLKFQKKRVDDGKTFIGGLSGAEHEKVVQATKLKEIKHAEIVRESAMNRNRHSALLKLLDAFGDDFFLKHNIDANDVEELIGTTVTIAENDFTKIDVEIVKSLSTTLKCFMHITWQKPIYVKSEDFDTTFQTERVLKEIVEAPIKFNATFGPVLSFKKTLLAPVMEQLLRFSVEDENNQKIDIWNFDF